MQFQKRVFKAIQGQAIHDMAITGHSSQGIFRIFQARQNKANPGKEIQYKKIPDDFRQEILVKAFRSNSIQGIFSPFKARQLQAMKLQAITEYTIPA